MAASRSGSAPATGASGPWRRRLVVLVVLAGLGALLVVGGRDRRPLPSTDLAEDVPVDDAVLPPVLLPDAPTAGRQFAARGSALWTRLDLEPAPRAEAVRAVGAGHVLVGDRLLPTSDDPVDDGLGRLPGPATSGVFDDDGRWAVAEAGRVVLGGVTTSVTAVVPDGWRPTGAAIAWQDGAPVLRDATGRLALLGDDGAPRWRTAEALVPDGPVGDRWLAGRREDGTPVAVALVDGRVVDLPAPALAIHGDIAVTRPDDVTAVELPTSAVAWRRPAVGAVWRALGEGLVAVESGAAVLVDPTTGAERGRVEGSDVVPTDEVVVVRDEDGIDAVSWSGRGRWRLRLAASATLLGVDATRVAVRLDPPAGARATVLETATGLVVADAVLPAAGDRTLVIDDDALWVLEAGTAVAVVDRRTGDDLDRAGAPPGVEAPRFRAGDRTVTIEAGAATVQGVADDATLWTLPLAAPLTAAPAAAGTSLVVLLADGTVAAVDPGTGTVRWRTVLASVPTAAASDGTVLLVGTRDGEVLRLDPEGQVVTRTDLGGGEVTALVAGRPAAAVVGSRLVGIDVDGAVRSP